MQNQQRQSNYKYRSQYRHNNSKKTTIDFGSVKEEEIKEQIKEEEKPQEVIIDIQQEQQEEPEQQQEEQQEQQKFETDKIMVLPQNGSIFELPNGDKIRIVYEKL